MICKLRYGKNCSIFLKLHTYEIRQTTIYIVMVLSTITGTMINFVNTDIVLVTVIL